MLHAGLDLHLLVAREDDSDVHVARVRLLLPEEVVHPRLDVVSKPSCLEPLCCEPILLTRASSRLVATLTLEPGKQQWIADHDEDLINLCEYWETYSRQIFSKWRTQTWWTFLPQSVHSTNGSTSRMSFFVDLNSDLAMCLHYIYYTIMFPTVGSDTSKLLHTRTLQNTEKSTRWLCLANLCRPEENICLILRLGLTGVVPEGHRVPWDVGHALLAKGVLVREKAGRWVPKSWRVSLGTSNIYDKCQQKVL